MLKLKISKTNNINWSRDVGAASLSSSSSLWLSSAVCVLFILFIYTYIDAHKRACVHTSHIMLMSSVGNIVIVSVYVYLKENVFNCYNAPALK